MLTTTSQSPSGSHTPLIPVDAAGLPLKNNPDRRGRPHRERNSWSISSALASSAFLA